MLRSRLKRGQPPSSTFKDSHHSDAWHGSTLVAVPDLPHLGGGWELASVPKSAGLSALGGERGHPHLSAFEDSRHSDTWHGFVLMAVPNLYLMAVPNLPLARLHIDGCPERAELGSWLGGGCPEISGPVGPGWRGGPAIGGGGCRCVRPCRSGWRGPGECRRRTGCCARGSSRCGRGTRRGRRSPACPS